MIVKNRQRMRCQAGLPVVFGIPLCDGVVRGPLVVSQPVRNTSHSHLAGELVAVRIIGLVTRASHPAGSLSTMDD